MKPIFSLLIAIAAAATASAGSITAVVNNGNWATASTWNLNRVPANGDTIIIPANFNIPLTTTVSLNTVLLKISGSLNLSNGANLNLNSASVIRVYSSARITGQGNDDQVKIGNTHVFKGNDPDVVGAVYADNTTGGGFAPMETLPVSFVNFYVSKYNGEVKISWTTSYEKNNSHFEVERSVDGMNWYSIAVIAAVGNSTSLNHYSYLDKKIDAAITYYRIKQVDQDATVTYTTIKSISGTQSSSTEITVKGNNDIVVSFSNIQSKVRVNVWSVNGQSMNQQSFTQSAYVSFRLGNPVPGIYVVQVIDESNNMYSKKVRLN